MEKIVELIFSNFFFVIIAIAGISNLFNKLSGEKASTDPTKKTNPSSDTSKPFKWDKMFDFDLEKWLGEESKEENTDKKATPNKMAKAQQYRNEAKRKTDMGKAKPSHSAMNTKTNPYPTLSSVAISGSASFEKTSFPSAEEEHHGFEFEETDLQRAVVMAEILGPPRSKRKSYRM